MYHPVPDVLSSWCSDDLHEQCSGVFIGAPCCCECHASATATTTSARTAHERSPHMATEKFHYTPTGGKKITLPKFKNIPVGVIRRVRKESQVEQMFSILEAVADEATIAKVDALDSEQLGELIQAWQEDSKVSAGESVASSTS